MLLQFDEEIPRHERVKYEASSQEYGAFFIQ